MASSYMRGMGSTLSELNCFPEASAGPGRASGIVGTDGAGLNYCSGFKAFHWPTNTALVC